MQNYSISLVEDIVETGFMNPDEMKARNRLLQTSLLKIAYPTAILKCVNDVRNPWQLLCGYSAPQVTVELLPCGERQADSELLGAMPALDPNRLGDPQFLNTHKVNLPYVVSEMAHGIATSHMVIKAAKAGMLGFLGSDGLSLADVDRSIDMIDRALNRRQLSWGSNLIHTPEDPALERAIVDLYLKRGVRRVSASAFMGISPEIHT